MDEINNPARLRALKKVAGDVSNISDEDLLSRLSTPEALEKGYGTPSRNVDVLLGRQASQLAGVPLVEASPQVDNALREYHYPDVEAKLQGSDIAVKNIDEGSLAEYEHPTTKAPQGKASTLIDEKVPEYQRRAGLLHELQHADEKVAPRPDMNMAAKGANAAETAMLQNAEHMADPRLSKYFELQKLQQLIKAGGGKLLQAAPLALGGYAALKSGDILAATPIGASDEVGPAEGTEDYTRENPKLDSWKKLRGQ